MGVRAVRLCLRRQDIFRTQLRALLGASAYGKLALLIPMIIDLDEVYRVKDIIHKVKDELVNKHIPFDNDVEFGVMIETPAGGHPERRTGEGSGLFQHRYERS